MAFWHRYPQTNFHELNADWILEQLSSLKTIVDEFTERVISMEDDVQDLKDRMTQAEEDIDAAEGRLDTAEGDIADLKDADIAIDGRLDALEGADIQGATMLSDMYEVDRDATTNTIRFIKNTYTAGVKGANVNDDAVLRAADSDYAGLMLPAEKEKMQAFTVSGNDVTFAGKVSAAAPTAGGDLATKGYVDSLAISGSASVGNATADVVMGWHEKYNVAADTQTLYLYTYGKILMMCGFIAHTLTDSHGDGTQLFYATIPYAYRPESGNNFPFVYLRNNETGELIPCRLGTAQRVDDPSHMDVKILTELSLASGINVRGYFQVIYFMN